MRPSAIALGTFDGVHRGHQSLLARLISAAAGRGLRSVVLTFPGPVRPVPGLLSTAGEKRELLSQLPIDEIVFLPNSSDITNQPAPLFFDRFLRSGLNARLIVAGHDFAFGYSREGNLDWLRRTGRAQGVEVRVVPPVSYRNEVISSSRIRKLLLEGAVQHANELLGRFYEIHGTPEPGRAIGRLLGFPTVNLRIPPEKLLPPGVFATWVRRGAALFPGVVNIGTRPTFFAGGELSVEVHLLGFSGAWPARRTPLLLCAKLRGEKRFKTAEALKRQIARDAAQAQRYFASRT